MKRFVLSSAVFFGVVVSLFTAAIPARAQSQELLQGTEVHLRLLTALSTVVAKSGDLFIAEVTEPVYLGSQMILPAGSQVNGTVGGVYHTKHFSIFRGQAGMNLSFRELQVDSRIFPAKLSIIGLAGPSTEDRAGKNRNDVKVYEGQVLQAKHDIKGDIIGGSIGIGGGTLIGAIASHAAGGFGFGLLGSAAYIMERKGKEVILPAETTIVVRVDDTVNLPKIVADSGERVPALAEAH